MRKSAAALWIASHFGALALGFWVIPRGGMPAGDGEARLPAKAGERPPREERKVPTAELLAAYGDSEFWSAAQARRNMDRGEASSTGRSEPYVAPEDRAAQTADIAAALGEQLEAVNRHKAYDHLYVKALIKRWMLADPAACARWLGEMGTRGVVWGDPFNGFAESLPAADLLDLIDDRWRPGHRQRALEAIAEKAGADEAASLPALLERLDEGDVGRFLNTAARHARPEDASFWLRFAAERSPNLIGDLANRWIQGPGAHWEWRGDELVPAQRFGPGSQGDWRETARSVIAAAEGTPAEAVFVQRLEQEETNAERGRLLALAEREPAAAMEQLLALEAAQGRDADEVRAELTRQVSNNFSQNSANWRSSEWDQALQASVLGERGIVEVINERLDQIATDLPDLFQPQLQKQALLDAMSIDPSVAVRIGVERGLTDRVVEVAREVFPAPGTPQAIAAEIILTMEERGLLEGSGYLRQQAADFTKEYLRGDPAAAGAWLSRLPPALAEHLLGTLP